MSYAAKVQMSVLSVQRHSCHGHGPSCKKHSVLVLTIVFSMLVWYPQLQIVVEHQSLVDVEVSRCSQGCSASRGVLGDDHSMTMHACTTTLLMLMQ